MDSCLSTLAMRENCGPMKPVFFIFRRRSLRIRQVTSYPLSNPSTPSGGMREAVVSVVHEDAAEAFEVAFGQARDGVERGVGDLAERSDLHEAAEEVVLVEAQARDGIAVDRQAAEGVVGRGGGRIRFPVLRDRVVLVAQQFLDLVACVGYVADGGASTRSRDITDRTARSFHCLPEQVGIPLPCPLGSGANGAGYTG